MIKIKIDTGNCKRGIEIKIIDCRTKSFTEMQVFSEIFLLIE